MSLPRYCKICRLLIHYPDLQKSDYDEKRRLFVGTGWCPSKHYELIVHEGDEYTEIRTEKIYYDEYRITLSHHEGIFYVHKDDELYSLGH